MKDEDVVVTVLHVRGKDGGAFELKNILERERINVISLPSLNEGVQDVDLLSSDLILIDVAEAMRLEDAMQELSWVRKNLNRSIPVVLIFSICNEEAFVQALELGADDYFLRPINSSIFLRKIRLLMARTSSRSTQSEIVRVGGLALNVLNHELFLFDERVALTLTEFRMLKELVLSLNRVVTRKKLSQNIFQGINVSSRTLDVHMCALRKKLRSLGSVIRTIRGIGYVLSEEECGAKLLEGSNWSKSSNSVTQAV